MPTGEVLTSEVPTSDVPTSNVPTSEVPTSNVPTSNVPTSNVRTSNVSTNEVPISELIRLAGGLPRARHAGGLPRALKCGHAPDTIKDQDGDCPYCTLATTYVMGYNARGAAQLQAHAQANRQEQADEEKLRQVLTWKARELVKLCDRLDSFDSDPEAMRRLAFGSRYISE